MQTVVSRMIMNEMAYCYCFSFGVGGWGRHCCNGALMAVIGWLQVINAALALAAKPNSKVAQDNMDLFKEQWEKQVRVLTDAVDDITSIDDFLSVSGKFLFK